MEYTSVFEMLKIGIGPSSSHTLGPWRAAQGFVRDLRESGGMERTAALHVHLYGSLALTGKGHGSDIAVMMGLSGADPVTVPVEEVDRLPGKVRSQGAILLGGTRIVPFLPETSIVYHMDERLPFHANGMLFLATDNQGNELLRSTCYSVGGGFVVKDGELTPAAANVSVRWPAETGEQLLELCDREGLRICDVVRENERSLRSDEDIHRGVNAIWNVMKEALFRGSTTDGVLPGGLEVSRRARRIVQRVTGGGADESAESWIERFRRLEVDFSKTLKLISAFAMAVNEENASFGRIVTAPTNGSAGVIPAVIMYYLCFSGARVSEREIQNFLLVAGVIGSIFRRGATISAAMGGCQAEIGVSSAMAAAALTEGIGGSPRQALMAGEIAMEHHLGMTCDPIGGLVQIPCIERNSMGAIKAIAAATIAMESDPDTAKVSFDDVVKTMWATAQDMNVRYKETSQGGLAVNVSVRVAEC